MNPEPDSIKVTTPPRELHPAGTFPAMCVDLIDLGMKVSDFQGQKSASQSCVFVFSTGETNSQGYAFFPHREINVSLNPKSTLYKFLSAWRGRPIDPKEAQDFELRQFVGKPALISIQHATSKAGNPRAEISSIMPLAKGMALPPHAEYKRADFWAERKKQYAAEYGKFVEGGVPKGNASYHGPLEVELSGDPVPF